jgi:hypothetical protein
VYIEVDEENSEILEELGIEVVVTRNFIHGHKFIYELGTEFDCAVHESFEAYSYVKDEEITFDSTFIVKRPVTENNVLAHHTLQNNRNLGGFDVEYFVEKGTGREMMVVRMYYVENIYYREISDEQLVKILLSGNAYLDNSDMDEGIGSLVFLSEE